MSPASLKLPTARASTSPSPHHTTQHSAWPKPRGGQLVAAMSDVRRAMPKLYTVVFVCAVVWHASTHFCKLARRKSNNGHVNCSQSTGARACL